MRPWFVRLVLLASLAVAVGAPAVWAQVEGTMRPVYLPAPSETDERLLALLSEPVEMSYSEIPLVELLASLSDLHSANFVVDRTALNDVGIAEDTPVTIELRGIALRTALKLMLEPLSLVCMERSEVFFVTTREKVDTTMFARVYPVADLAESAEDLETLCRTITQGTNGRWLHVLDQNAPEIAGSITAVPRVRSLVVKQSQIVHDEIVELLTQLRHAQALVTP